MFFFKKNPSANLCLLIGAFNLFIFNITCDKVGLISAILLFVFHIFYILFVPLFLYYCSWTPVPPPPIPCVLGWSWASVSPSVPADLPWDRKVACQTLRSMAILRISLRSPLWRVHPQGHTDVRQVWASWLCDPTHRALPLWATASDVAHRPLIRTRLVGRSPWNPVSSGKSLPILQSLLLLWMPTTRVVFVWVQAAFPRRPRSQKAGNRVSVGGTQAWAF